MISGNYLSGDYVRHLPSGKAGWLQKIDRDDTWIVKTHAQKFTDDNWAECDLCKLPTPNLDDLRLPDDVSPTVRDLIHIGQSRSNYPFTVGGLVCLRTLPNSHQGSVIRFERDAYGRDRVLVNDNRRRKRFWWFVSGVVAVQIESAIVPVSPRRTLVEATFKRETTRSPLTEVAAQQLSLF